MTLATHINPDDLIQELREQPNTAEGTHCDNIFTRHAVESTTPYSTRYASREEIPKFRMPEYGAPAEAVGRMVRDELDLDGIPNLNMASFVGTFMERDAEELLVENVSKNLADADEYPALMTLHTRCISMISQLWHAQPGESAMGTATTGSSEGILLAGLAMKRRWQDKRRAEGKGTQKPNIIMGANAQVALLKFARYFDVEARVLDVSEQSQFRLDPSKVRDSVDENTIGVFVIMGSTYTGHYEPVEEISTVLDRVQAETGLDVPIHVDGASGAFVAPFSHAGAGGPKWDFELPRVKSINTSGHKFGLVYVGLGWVIWRDRSYLPRDLIFQLHYLGGTEESYTLNFSRPGLQVIGQYYNLIRLGTRGYREIMENCLANARLLSQALERTGWFICVSDVHRKRGVLHYDRQHHHGPRGTAATEVQPSGDGETSADYNAGLPVVAFRFSDEFGQKYPHVRQESVSLLLRAKQYIIPNYPLPPAEEQTEILRVVVRESMAADLIDRLIGDIVAVTERLMASEAVDLAALHTGPTSVERRRAQPGYHKRKRPVEEEDKTDQVDKQGQTRHPMSEGIHRSVC